MEEKKNVNAEELDEVVAAQAEETDELIEETLKEQDLLDSDEVETEIDVEIALSDEDEDFDEDEEFDEDEDEEDFRPDPIEVALTYAATEPAISEEEAELAGQQMEKALVAAKENGALSDEEIEQLLDTVGIALETATEGELITQEEADEARDFLDGQYLKLDKAAAKIKKMWYGIGALGLAALACLGVLGGYIAKDMASRPFAGLSVGKSYASNITLPDYTTITYTDTYVAPTDEEVQEEINSDLKAKNHSKEIEVTDALQNGDVTKIDFTGYIDGEKYDNACGEDQELELGSDKFIDGFEDGLVGKKVGESVTLDLFFPDDYTEQSLQGKAVKFEVKIKSATRVVYDELTDAIVKEITDGEYITVDAYKKSVYDELDQNKKDEAMDAARNEVWTAVAQGCTLKRYPANMYNYYVNKLDAQYKNYYASYGVKNLEGLMQAMGMELKAYVESQITYEYAIYAIAARQGITLTDEDYEALLTKYSCEDKAALAEKMNIETWELDSSLLYNKVTDYLMEVATAK